MKKQTNFFCRGCSKDFCFVHLTEHGQFLNKQFGETISHLKNNSQNHPLMKQIDEWGNESILKIKQKANECRQLLTGYTNQSIHLIE